SDMMVHLTLFGTLHMLARSLLVALAIASLLLGFGSEAGLWLTVSIACALLALLLLRRAGDSKAWCIAALLAAAVWMPFFLFGYHEANGWAGAARTATQASGTSVIVGVYGVAHHLQWLLVGTLGLVLAACIARGLRVTKA
ncbi:MAG: hypothetical protein AAGF29_05865, partial [Pseudomonadota bacterium]